MSIKRGMATLGMLVALLLLGITLYTIGVVKMMEDVKPQVETAAMNFAADVNFERNQEERSQVTELRLTQEYADLYTEAEKAAYLSTCATEMQDLSNYMEASSAESFSYNQVPSNWGGHRFVIAVTYKDSTKAILYGEAGTTWIPDETVATAMVNLIKDGGGYETACIANGFAEAVKPSLGEIPVVKVP